MATLRERLQQAVDDLNRRELEIIQEELDTHSTITDAAEALGISRRWLHYKIKRHNLRHDESLPIAG